MNNFKLMLVVAKRRTARVLSPLAAVLVLSAPMALLARAAESESYDYVIVGGKIVDGTGNPWFMGDIAIRAGRIVRILPPGKLAGATARQRIDAKGLVVCPGFIDTQSQSKAQLLIGDGRVVSKVTQGVTTEIMGEGSSNAPQNKRTIALERQNDPKIAAVDAEFTGPHGFDKWLRAMLEHGSSVNFGSFVGAGAIRVFGKGLGTGAATSEETEVMKHAVAEAMSDGAFGVASALIYPPDSYASTNELIEITKAAQPYGGIYITHMRSEADTLLEALDEAIRIGRESHVPVEIYHFKSSGRRNWYKTPSAIARINAARAEGLDITADMYPYTAGSTGIAVCIPPLASADGKLFENLADPAKRAKIRAEILNPKTSWEDECQFVGPDGVLILGLRKPENQKYNGRRLSEVAASENKHWVDTLIDLILSEHQSIPSAFFLASEDNLKLQMQQPWISFATDEGGHDPEHQDGLVHPRSYGTYPRVLGKYVRDERLLTLEDAIRKMTSAPAARLSIRDRGLLREGYRADVVIFDPETITDRATYENPHQLSVGVRYVLVNGTPVVVEGKHTGAKPGEIVRGPGYHAE